MSQPMFPPLYQIPDRSASAGTARSGRGAERNPGNTLGGSALSYNSGSIVKDLAAALTTVLLHKITKFLRSICSIWMSPSRCMATGSIL